jgi:tetratricopeptide (TPR) repeat protein
MRSLAAALLLLSAPAAAADAEELWRDGRFAAAAAAARANGSHAVAARAQLVAAAFEAGSKADALAQIAQARRSADAAVALNPRDADAHVQRGIAIGYTAKLTRDPGLAKQARSEMERAMALDPDAALPWAALGGWHGDSIVDLGAMLAGVVLGAKRGEALRSFDTALVKEPTSPVYPTYYAFTLLRMDAGNAPRARALLERAVALKPRDGFEALMRYRAAQALAPLQRGDIKAARALVPKLQPFGKLAG